MFNYSFRRKKWLEVIGRPDLMTPQVKPKSHLVCSVHFDKTMIKYIPVLKTDAVPTISLPNAPSTSDVNTSTDYKHVSTQTDKSCSNRASVKIKGPDKKSPCKQTASDNDTNETTQTSQSPLSATSRKRKLRGEFKELEQKKTKLEHELNKIKKRNLVKNILKMKK